MLVGFEIVEEYANSCVIKNVSVDNSSEFDNFLRRAFLTMIAMAEKTIQAVEADDLEVFDEILALEETANRVTNYAERILNKNYDASNTYHYIITWLLESICDDYNHLGILLKADHSCRKNMLPFLQRILVLVRTFYDFYYKYNDKKLDALKRDVFLAEQEIMARIDDVNQSQAPLVYAHTIVQRISDAISSTACLNH
jgi:hypothetical protein